MRETPVTGDKFAVGMKLEAIDPLNLSTISPATVTKVNTCMKELLIICITCFHINKSTLQQGNYQNILSN